MEKLQNIDNLLEDTRARIHSMAIIHSQLYQSDRFDQIDLKKHVRELMDHLSHVYADSRKKINAVIESSDVYLSVDQAVPCALILNELISNAFKHAFKKFDKGTIQVSINNSTGNTVFLGVKDDGEGIPEEVYSKQPERLGLKLVSHLVAGQLKGEMNVKTAGGTEVCIQFKRIK